MFAILAVVAVAATMLVIAATSASADPVDKVTICHRTNSDSNPYVEITPDVSGVLDGHDKKHDEPFIWGPTLKANHQKWGDVIPAFDYMDGGVLKHFAGLNLDTTGGPNGTTTGAELLENGCSFSEGPPPVMLGSLEVTKSVLSTPAGTPTPTDFTLHVSCDDESVNEDVVFPLTGGTKTYDDLVAGITCTVTEKNTTTFSTGTVVTFNGVQVDPAVGVDVEIPADDTATVAVLNDFTNVLPAVVVVTPTSPVTEAAAAAAPVAAVAVVASPAFTG
jgi:hypothetical protein